MISMGLPTIDRAELLITPGPVVGLYVYILTRISLCHFIGTPLALRKEKVSFKS